MKSSELIDSFARLSREYGDLDVYCECDGTIQEAGSVVIFENVYVVMPFGQSVPDGLTDQLLDSSGSRRLRLAHKSDGPQ